MSQGYTALSEEHRAIIRGHRVLFVKRFTFMILYLATLVALSFGLKYLTT